MSEAYNNMRAFWLDVSNLENKHGLQAVGKDEILIAGTEFCMKDHNGQAKNILIAGSVLGDASMYFENNSKSGIGGFLGGGSQKARDLTAKLLGEAAKLSGEMMQADTLKLPSEPAKITLFAVSKKTIFYVEVEALQISRHDNPFYNFFAYTQQLISVFREQEEAAAKAKGGVASNEGGADAGGADGENSGSKIAAESGGNITGANTLSIDPDEKIAHG
ncbi:MAG: hypothetical protein LBM71_03880 [Elusimicrobiota bacterium]|jgi:hypothetical protein|nr:hypothetical protein [Elusimicrobiota bacterium]